MSINMIECPICQYHYASARLNCPTCGTHRTFQTTEHHIGGPYALHPGIANELIAIPIVVAKGAERARQLPQSPRYFQLVD
jgi:hypothetical protein